MKSTLYKSLSYIAKELLIKVGGQQSLTQYAGFPVRIADKAGFDVMIADYEAAHADKVFTDQQLHEAGDDIAAFVDTLNQHNHVFL